MNKIVSKEHFSANVVKLEVEAPLIARSRKAGHFVIVKVGEKGERIPLTIAGADTTKGTITLVIQAVGGSSKKICELNAGDYITDLSVRWGKPPISRKSARSCVPAVVSVWLLYCRSWRLFIRRATV